MKVIDLLNRIANNDEIPKKIEFDDITFEYDGDYYSSKGNVLLEEYCHLTTSLNDEVEVIEEDKKIEKLDLKYDDIIYGINFKKEILMYCDNLQTKINEIIEKINKE